MTVDTHENTIISVDDFKNYWLPALESMAATRDDIYELIKDSDIYTHKAKALYKKLLRRQMDQHQKDLLTQEMIMTPDPNDPSLEDPMASARIVDPSDEAFFDYKG